MVSGARWTFATAGTAILLAAIWWQYRVLLRSSHGIHASPSPDALSVPATWAVASLLGLSIESFGTPYASLLLIPVIAHSMAMLTSRQAILHVTAATSLVCAGLFFYLDATATQTAVLVALGVLVGLTAGFLLTRSLMLARRFATREEHGRLGREIHDGFLQFSTAGLQAMRRARTALNEGDLEQARRALDSAILSTERASQEARALLSSDDHRVGTVSAHELVEDCIAATAGLSPLSVSSRVALADPQLPAGVARHIRAVISEALSNVHRHANARHALVTLDDAATPPTEDAASAGGGFIEVRIEDDGVGLQGGGENADRDHAACDTGHGLPNIRVRAALTGGGAVIEPSFLGGVRVTATFGRATEPARPATDPT